MESENNLLIKKKSGVNSKFSYFFVFQEVVEKISRSQRDYEIGSNIQHESSPPVSIVTDNPQSHESDENVRSY